MTPNPSGQILVRTLPGEKHTPFGLASKLNAGVILESSSFSHGRERYSLLLVKEAFQIHQMNDGIFLIADGKRQPVNTRPGTDILEVITGLADRLSPEQINEAHDFPVPAGGIGFLSFEFSAYCDTMIFPDRVDPLGLPLAAFIFGHVFVIFDHYTDQLHLLGINYGDSTDTDLKKSPGCHRGQYWRYELQLHDGTEERLPGHSRFRQ